MFMPVIRLCVLYVCGAGKRFQKKIDVLFICERFIVDFIVHFSVISYFSFRFRLISVGHLGLMCILSHVFLCLLFHIRLL